jgi:hypothetical protein
MESDMIKDQYIQKLRTGTRTITFTKVDGTERVMNATLLESVVPATEGKRAIPASNLVVFDTDKQAWRSVRIDSIKSFV